MAIKNGWQIWWWWYCCVRWNGILRTNFRCSELNLVNELFIELKMCDVNCVRTKKIKICKREREIGINSTFALAQLLRTTSHFPKEEKAMRTNCENVYGSIISSAQIPLRTVFTRKKNINIRISMVPMGSWRTLFSFKELRTGTKMWVKRQH